MMRLGAAFLHVDPHVFHFSRVLEFKIYSLARPVHQALQMK